MADLVVDVFENGAVRLGSRVVCDGFAEGYPFRVQTHIHDDHMEDFDKSKGLQDLLMSPETYELLVADHNADLEYRDNLHKIIRGNDEYLLDDNSKLYLFPSNHMLGSCQVALELPNGLRVGYSSDFGWPLKEVIKVDQLVVDSTYGSPRSVRSYSQGLAEESLHAIVSERLRHGSVHIQAYRGTIERVLHLLGGSVEVPILASERLIREVQVYQKYGFGLGNLEDIKSQTGQIAMQQRAYIRLYSKGDGFSNELIEGTSIVCSAYMSRDKPLLTYSDRAYRVALSNHADFNETLEYIKATEARQVITDNTRNHGWELAIAINARLPNVDAKPSTNKPGVGRG